MKVSTAPAVLALLVNAFVWGLSWWPLRTLDALGLHSLWATALVYLVACLAILAWRPGAAAGLARTRALWWLFLASGLTNVCFNWAVTIGEVVRVVLLFYLMPVWAVLLARWLLGEPIRTATLARIALALAGAAIVLTPADAGLPLPGSLADWLGVAGGASFALTNVLLRREGERPDSHRALAMFGGGALVAATLATLLTSAGVAPAPPAPAPAWLLGVAGLAIAMLGGNLALMYGAARLSAATTAVVMLTEIVFAAGSAVLIGGEALATRTLVGGAMIIASALLASVARPAPSSKP